jgi:ABC-type multidrug transport system permease subunit
MFFPLERNVFLKEKNSCLYGVVPYFISRNIVELPYTIIFPLLTSTIIYWFAGLHSTPEQFFTFFLIQYLLGFCGSSMGFFLGSVIVDAKSIATGIPLITYPLALFAGFYKNLNNLPVWIGWIQYINPLKYGFGAMVENQELYTNSSNIDLLNLNVGLWESIGIMFALGIAFRTLSLFFLWLRSR